MTRENTMAAAFGDAPMFYRSVALSRDLNDRHASQSFVLTDWLERQVARLADGLAAGSTRRAWRMIGDFGVGKSALALALIQALDPRLSETPTPVRLSLESGGTQAPRLFPLVITGSAEGLAGELRQCIQDALEDAAWMAAADRKKIVSASDPFKALTLFKDAAARSEQFDGALLVVDEMGRFIEAADGSSSEIYELQTLAEAASRSGNAPLCVILILHKGFQSYAEDWRAARRLEWEKVAERYEELVFDHPLSHTAALVSEALKVEASAVPDAAAAAYAAACDKVRKLGWLGPRDDGHPIDCWPIHPAALPIMARFFANFGQNERSLFGFLASDEPTGLRSYASRTPANGNTYGLPEFFDYVATSFGHRLSSRAGAAEWSRIRGVLDRTESADPVEVAILKCVGLLDMLDSPDLRSTAEALSAALGARYGQDEIEAAIDRLLASGLMFRRPGRDEFRLWTSNRVDLSRVWQDAAREVPADSIAKALSRHLALLPVRSEILARRHSVLTGTNRRFAISLVHCGALKGARMHEGADGGVVAVLCDDMQGLLMAKAWASEVSASDPTILVLVAPRLGDFEAPLIDLLRHRWIAANVNALKEDAHAASEIERSIVRLEQGIVQVLEDAFGMRGDRPVRGIEAIRKGVQFTLEAPLHVVLSDICDETYDRAPLVDNEMVNRHVLTSAGAGARQRLIERMFEAADGKDLGFDDRKYPPERALFLSILRRGLVHRLVDETYAVDFPDKARDPLRLLPVLQEIESTLRNSGERVSLLEIYEKIEGLHYGTRRGLAPLLFAIVLVARAHRIAMFERGTYCTRIDGAAFMRILKGPEHFSFQWVQIEGVRAEVFRKLVEVLESTRDSEPSLRSLVDPLIRFGVALPHFTQNAEKLSSEAKAVRRALADARSPVDLIFKDLPIACGFEPIPAGSGDTPKEGSAQFVARLAECVAELRGCYPALLGEIRHSAMEAAHATDRPTLSTRARGLAFRVQDQRLRTFLMRVADDELGEDSWAEALGGAVVGKPPSRWLERDVAAWHSSLSELAGLFLRVETLSFGEGDTGRDAVRIAITRADGQERAEIVDLDGISSDQRDALGAIRRLAVEAGLTLSEVAAHLSLSDADRPEADETPVREVKS